MRGCPLRGTEDLCPSEGADVWGFPWQERQNRIRMQEMYRKIFTIISVHQKRGA